MATIGIKVETTQSSEKTRTSLLNFYKGISTDRVVTELPCSINATETYNVNVSTSNYILIVPEESIITAASLEITLTNATSETLKVTGAGFMLLNFDNITSISIKNTHLTDSCQVYLVY